MSRLLFWLELRLEDDRVSPKEPVEITWPVRYAPLATAATRPPYAIYLKYRLRNKQNQARAKS
jgi:hypothetical protein